MIDKLERFRFVRTNYFQVYVSTKYIITLITRRFTDEIMAVLKLDNQTVAQTSWKPCSQQAWDQR